MPDIVAVRAALQTALADPTATIYLVEPFNPHRYGVETAAPLDAGTAASIQSALDTGAVYSTARQAQDHIDTWPVEFRALLFALLDQLNTIRAALPVPLGAITMPQALAVVRAKAGTLL